MAGYRTRTRHVHAERVGRCVDPEQRDALDEQVRAALDDRVSFEEASLDDLSGAYYWLTVDQEDDVVECLAKEVDMLVLDASGTIGVISPEAFAYTYEVDD